MDLNTFILKTEEKTRNKLSSLDFNSNNRFILTKDDLNKQKLFDFISDKKKLSINSYFDHIGAKKFLNGKEEAMKKIELNEILEEEEQIKKNKRKKSLKKRWNKMKSTEYLVNKKYNENNDINNDESIIKIKKSKKKKSKSSKYVNNIMNNKLKNLKDKFNDFD